MLIPFLSPLDTMTDSPREREIFGAPSLDKFFRHTPVAFDFNIWVVIPPLMTFG